jgi:2-desacetyl-2-hydroxyethyl bacteriochlorophyllide A dehydrogenase
MKTSVIHSPKQIRIIETELPAPGSEEILIRLSGTGLCVSNLPVWEGREWFSYPFEPGSPGHEGYGVVEQTGEHVSGFTRGDLVVFLSQNAYAEYDKAHQSNVVKIPETLNGNLFPGEPLACAVNIIKRSDIKAGQKVVVIGAGFIGCLLIQLIKNAGAEVIAVSRRKSSLQFAEMSGADYLVHFNEVWEAKDKILQLVPGGSERVIEATGVQKALDLASHIMAERGRMIIAGYHQDGLRSVNMQVWNWNGIDVINAHERDPAIYTSGLQKAVELVSQGVLRPTELITHHFSFSEINNAFNMMHNSPEGFLKGVITYA